MTWLDSTLDALAQQPATAYVPGGAPAAEPTAIATLALVAHGRTAAAKQAASELAKMQVRGGAVGVRAGEDSPGWPTSLAICAWQAIDRRISARATRSVAWLVNNRGRALERSSKFGHNMELVGWSYAEQTHSWVEPTAFAVLALKATGKGGDAIAREGVAVLTDRQLPGGGLNYGNTYVLGQLLRPHVQPTGIALLALAGETDRSGRLAKSITWLRRSIGPSTTPLSLGWALLGLKAHGEELPQAGDWLSRAAGTLGSPPLAQPAMFKLALLALAAKGWPL